MADADVATTSDNKNIDLPKALIRRMVKAKLSELSGDPSKEFNVNKDALLALAESAKVFVSFIASTANDICKESKRQTMSAEDVFKALDEMDFGDMVAPLRQELAEMKASKKKPAPKRKADEDVGGTDQQQEAPPADGDAQMEDAEQ